MNHQGSMAPLIAVMEINPKTTAWAEWRYPQFLLPHLGEKRRLTYLMSRALLLSSLQRYYTPKLNVLPDIAYNKHQKPYFLNAPFHFNLTHTEDAVAVIILPHRATHLEAHLEIQIETQIGRFETANFLPRGYYSDQNASLIGEKENIIGIDLESIQPRKSFAALLQRTFSPLEISWILEPSTPRPLNRILHRVDLPASLTKAQQKRFFLLWSTKEAYLKADGRGLQGLKSLEIDPIEQALYGDLKAGKLYAGTRSFNNNIHSLALYLPQNSADHLTLTILDVESEREIFFTETIKWDLILSDMPKQHNSQ